MRTNKVGPVKDKNVLFLQGPMGDFFQKVERVFQAQGAKTFRIGFNAGDALFANRDSYIAYRGKRKEWLQFIKTFLENENIHMIFLFGDCRFYQSMAIFAANRLGIEVFVFEEGYLRPNFITLERHGVNDHSLLPRTRAFYDAIALDAYPEPPPKETHNSFAKMNFSATLYYLAGNLLQFRYPHYKHHRDFSALQEAFFGVRNWLRKYKYQFLERGRLAQIQKTLSKRYFFVPLQTHNDFQISKHSKYDAIECFIEEVLRCFALHADKQDFIIFKHHPVDRGRKDYASCITRLAHKLKIVDRVLIFYDVHLPSCLKHAKGTVTINSTVGLSSVLHGTPTIALGKAVYDIDGLTNRNVALKDFWHRQIPPDAELFQKYRRYMIYHTQLNGSFYGLLPEFDFSAFSSSDQNKNTLGV